MKKVTRRCGWNNIGPFEPFANCIYILGIWLDSLPLLEEQVAATVRLIFFSLSHSHKIVSNFLDVDLEVIYPFVTLTEHCSVFCMGLHFKTIQTWKLLQNSAICLSGCSSCEHINLYDL